MMQKSTKKRYVGGAKRSEIRTVLPGKENVAAKRLRFADKINPRAVKQGLVTDKATKPGIVRGERCANIETIDVKLAIKGFNVVRDLAQLEHAAGATRQNGNVLMLVPGLFCKLVQLTAELVVRLEI